MKNEEYRVELSEDFGVLCTALGLDYLLEHEAEIMACQRKALADVSVRNHARCAIDYLIDGLAIPESVRLQRAAQSGGYRTPQWVFANRAEAGRASAIHELGAPLPKWTNKRR